MFGLGMGELIIIAIVALLALGPDRLPDAAKKIGGTIRDLRRQTGELKKTIEADAQLGDAMKEIRSALHDDPFREKPRNKKKPPPTPEPAAAAGDAAEPEAESPATPAVVPAEGAVARDEESETPEPVSETSDVTEPSAPPVEDAEEEAPKTEPIMIDMSEYQRYVHMWGPAAAAEKYGTTLEEAEAAISAVVGTIERESSDG